MNKIKHCNFCEYDWEPRVEDPKACPRCHRRFDYYVGKKYIDVLREFGLAAEN